MSHTLKLLVPVGLGLLAFVVNWFAMQSKTTKIGFIMVTRSLSPGDTFRLEDLGEARMERKYERLRETAIPYDETGVSIVHGQIVQREFLEGDIVFWRDVAPQGPELDLREGEVAILVSLDSVRPDRGLMTVGDEIRLRFVPRKTNADTSGVIGAEKDAGGPTWVGPFRLVSVGSQLMRDSQGVARSGGSVSTIGVAVQRNSTDIHDRRAVELLEDFCDGQQMGEAQLLGIEFQRSGSSFAVP